MNSIVMLFPVLILIFQDDRLNISVSGHTFFGRSWMCVKSVFDRFNLFQVLGAGWKHQKVFLPPQLTKSDFRSLHFSLVITLNLKEMNKQMCY